MYTSENLIKFFRGVIDIVIKVTNFIQNILCTQQVLIETRALWVKDF